MSVQDEMAKSIATNAADAETVRFRVCMRVPFSTLGANPMSALRIPVLVTDSRYQDAA
ncbi:MAG: hypothetical protein Tsb0020_35100 [Haliangiales bacterium]